MSRRPPRSALTDTRFPDTTLFRVGRPGGVYPAAALRRWGRSSTKYKGSANADACRTLASEFAAGCGPLSAAAATCLDGCDDDGLDAFVCAIVAKASLGGQTDRKSVV